MSTSSPSPQNSRRLLLIGWDAADWNVINPLIAEGKMPALAGLMERGCHGRLETLYPALSPMLWTSIATGKRPYKHGIHGFSEPDPSGQGVRPVTNLSRKTKALWNILQQNGLQSNVVGWWPSHPAEPIDGVMVSNHYHSATSVNPDDKWPMSPGTVHPPRLREELAKLRFHPAELMPEHLLPFIPKAAQIDQEKDRRLTSLAKTLAECITINNAATALIQNEPWDFMGVYFDAIDHFSHLCMKYHPPRQEWVNEKDFEIYKDVVAGAYQFHDMMLGTMLSLVDDDTTVMLISDHGFHPDHLRPRELPNEPAGPAAEHSPFGIFVAAGPDIAKSAQVQSSGLLDITPTILQAFGLPVGEDMDGRVLLEAFADPKPIKPIPSWDDVPGECGWHASDAALDPEESQAAMKQLVALGYIEDVGEELEEGIAKTTRELKYNEARSYMDGNRHIDAIPTLRECWNRWPEETRFGVQLIQCHLALMQIAEARETMNLLVERKKAASEAAATELQEMLEKLNAEDKTPEDMDEKQAKQAQQLRARASLNPYGANMLEGTLLFAEADYEAALKCFEQAEPVNDQRPEVYISMGQALHELERYDEAVARFGEALALESTNPEAHLGLCRSQLQLDALDEAESSARASVNLSFQNPWAHYFLATVLIRKEQFRDAENSLHQAIAQNPNFPEAHAALADLYDGPLKDAIKAEEQRQLEAEANRMIADLQQGRLEPTPQADAEPVDELLLQTPSEVILNEQPLTAAPEDVITIVTGLPRSGTSMMMNMLDAAGLEVLTDGNREADEDNPRGYFEFDSATQLRTNHDWIPEARGKVVKVVAQLLRYLPKNETYRFIMMERPLDEVLISQTKMLARQGQEVAGDTTALKRAFGQQLTKVRQQLDRASSPSMRVPFAQCIADPLAVAEQLIEFLGVDIPPDTIVDRVDSRLYRSRPSDESDTH